MSKYLLLISLLFSIFVAYSQQVELSDTISKKQQTAPYAELTENKPIISNIKIYPNPIIENLNLSFETQIKKDITIIIFNYLGNIVYSEILNPYNGNVEKEIQFSSFSPGIYFLQIKYGKHIVTKQIKKT